MIVVEKILLIRRYVQVSCCEECHEINARAQLNYVF